MTDLDQKQLGKTLWNIADTPGDAYEYLIGQFAAGSGRKAGEFYTPQQISSILSGIVTLDSQEPKTGKRKKLNAVFDFACGSGSLLLNVRHRMAESGGTISRIVVPPSKLGGDDGQLQRP